MTEGKVFLLNKVQIEHYWPRIVQCLEQDPELWNKYLSLEGMHQRALAEHMQIWVVCPGGEDDLIRIVLFSQILVSDVGKSLQIFWMWGDGALKALSCISLVLDRFAEQCGCETVSVVAGRLAWLRALKGFGEFEAVSIRRKVRPRMTEH